MSKTNDVSPLDRYALADDQLHAVAGGTWSELIIGMADAIKAANCPSCEAAVRGAAEGLFRGGW
jgi:hypothetical protein